SSAAKEMMEHKKSPPFYVSSISSSFFSEEVGFPAERKVGFWKQEAVSNGHGPESHVATTVEAGSRPNVPSSLDKLGKQMNIFQTKTMAIPLDCFWEAPKVKTAFESRFSGAQQKASLSPVTWSNADRALGSRGNSFLQATSIIDETLDKLDSNKINVGNGRFSSSFSDLFEKKLKLSSRISVPDHFVDTSVTQLDEDELFESLEELESHTIGNLLPDDDELLSGVVDDIDYISQPNNGEETEDFDLFSSVGGMELEADILDSSTDYSNNKSLDAFVGISASQQGGSNGSAAGEHPYGEHPSRTLFVRNINSNVEDSELRDLFEQYGAIRTLYTACKHRGFVMISYYDIRSARSAMRALQNKPLRRRKLDIHFSIPKDNPSDKDINQGTLVVFNLDPSVSNDDLRQIFGVYGEVKEIRETPHKRHHKFIEFYDVRSAEAALRALNRSDIAGKRIKLEPSRPGGARRLMQQLCQELEQEEALPQRQQGTSSMNNSPSGPHAHWGMSSCSVDSGAMPALQSNNRVSLNLFMDNSLHGASPSIPHSLSSPIRVAAIGNHAGQAVQGEPVHSLGHISLGIHRLPTYHPQSLPEYSNGVVNGLPYSPSGSVSTVTAAMASRPPETIEGRHLHRVGSNNMNNSPFDHSDSVFGVAANGSFLNPHSSPNGSSPLPGHQFVWGNPNSYHHHPHSPIMWPASSSYAPGVHVRPQPQPQPHGFPGSQGHLINAVLPSHHHHVGSAPISDFSLLDRRHGYIGESQDTSFFRSGSLGAVGLSGAHGVHSLQLGAHTLMSQMGANNVVDPSVSSPSLGAMPSQQRCHLFPNNGSLMSLHGSLENANERGRSRRTDNNANQVDNKKQYQLDIDRILRGEDTRTTLMIKNIPNKYTSKMLLAAIDEHHRGTYDFIYLPIDFKNKCNVGYSFINMIGPSQIVPFFQAFNGKKWEKFNSEKVASLAYARIQGKAALIAHFQNSSLMNEDKRCRPILFHSDGPNVGDQEPFPIGVNVRTRPGKNRTSNCGSHQ
ncbi:hypothetical protein KI387_001330, partial [Taxus chinensis]